MQAEHLEEAKEGLGRDVLESREALGLAPAGGGKDDGEGEGDGEGQEEEEAVPPQVLKERIESVIEVLSEFQVRWVPCVFCFQGAWIEAKTHYHEVKIYINFIA